MWLLVTWSFSSSLSSFLMTTTGGALCSFWRLCETSWCGPCLMASTSRLGIDMMITTSSRLMCVTSTRFTARISSPTFTYIWIIIITMYIRRIICLEGFLRRARKLCVHKEFRSVFRKFDTLVFEAARSPGYFQLSISFETLARKKFSHTLGFMIGFPLDISRKCY